MDCACPVACPHNVLHFLVYILGMWQSRVEIRVYILQLLHETITYGDHPRIFYCQL